MIEKNFGAEAGFLNSRALIAFALCSVGVLLAMVGFAGTPLSQPRASAANGTMGLPFAYKAAEPSGNNAQVVNLPASPATSGWSIVSSPNASGAQNNVLPGVTCTSGMDCWAVGYSFVGSKAVRTLIEHWGGATWTALDSPNSSLTQDNALNAVACASASDCWAVGYYDASFSGGAFRTLIQHWDGNSWTIVSSPNTSNNQDNLFAGVACASASDCWAVGEYRDNEFSPAKTLVEHWDGASWMIVSSTNPGPTKSNSLIGVTCIAAANCWAVGYYVPPTGVAQTLIEHWDGTAWTTAISDNSLPVEGNFLSGISCPSSSDCWAVGYHNNSSSGANQTLVEHWDGILWRVVTSPDNNSAKNNYLNGVTCLSTAECWAAGDYYNGAAYQTLIERWDGSSWAIVDSPDSDPQEHNILYGVACASQFACRTVGYYSNDANGVDQTLIEYWDGASWAISASANPVTIQNNILNSLTCPSNSDCWAVGYHVAATTYQTLIEHWDGAAWTLVTAPNPASARTNFLNGVTCASVSDCWAVGQSSVDVGAGNPYQTLIEHWDGSSWTIVSSPNTDTTQNNALNAVTCASASQCWAVGDPTLIEKWNGTRWSIVSFPQSDATLTGVTCTSTSDCWAVGYSSATVIAHWDGSAWTVVPSPNQPSANNYLFGVTCASASECWATGYYYTGSPTQTLVEQWDGSSWTIINSPNTSATVYNQLNAIACASASNCFAVGYAYPVTSASQNLIEQWNGASWIIVPSANSSPTQNNQLNAVSCASASDCWAAGYYVAEDGVARTFFEHYTPSPAQLNAVVSRQIHGNVGAFDVDLLLTGSPGIECRSGGVSGNYRVVFTFANTLASVTSASVTDGTGSVSSDSIDSTDAHSYIVNLTGVTNAQFLTVSLTNVTDSSGNFSSAISAHMGVLIGDVNASGVVTSGDTNLCKAQALQPVTSANFRNDINVSGSVTTGDVNIIKQNALSQLPP